MGKHVTTWDGNAYLGMLIRKLLELSFFTWELYSLP